MSDKKVVTVYQLINQLSKRDDFKLLMKSGIIPIQYLDWKVIYEFYTKERSRGIRHSEAITFTAEEFGKSDNWVWKVKYKMESKIR